MVTPVLTENAYIIDAPVLTFENSANLFWIQTEIISIALFPSIVFQVVVKETIISALEVLEVI